MYEEVERLVAEVRREVTAPAEGGPATRLLRATRQYPASADAIWAALTRADRLSRWFAPVEGDLRPGGRYLLNGNARGVIESCDPGRRFAVTWESAGETGRVGVQLAAPSVGECAVVIEHVASADPDRWRKFGPGAIGVGWDMALLGLGRHLGAPEATDFVEKLQEWTLSDEGRTFVRQSASAWGKAAAADGEDLVVALEAAARAAQVYAGEGSDAG